jgi:hypothetical protein
MGTTLTGTTPQDTYDSLIKVTDNGPLSATAKYLSDGLGNDSVLALSTAAAGIGTTTIVSGTKLTVGGPLAAVGSAGTMGTFETSASACFIGLKDASGSLVYLGGDDGNFLIQTPSSSYSTKLTLTDAGNVGIGTDAPSQKLHVSGGYALFCQATIGSGADANSGLRIVAPVGTTHYNWMVAAQQNINNGFEITPSTAVGGTTFNSPALSISATTGVVSIKSGIQFPATQVASADANTLDDYEEGTWTMGVSFGGASVGVTTLFNTGSYTKIGRQVTVNGYLALTSKGSSTGNALITGLPFTVGNTNSNYAAASIHFYSISFANQMFARVNKNSTDIVLAESTEAGVFSQITDTNFANDSEVMVLATYFV